MPKQKRLEPAAEANRLDALMSMGADFVKRRIYLFGEINTDSAYRFVTALQTMDDGPGPITVMLSSPGGSEPDGYVIYDAIRLNTNPITIVGYGAVQSIAALILQAAHRRWLLPECRFMIHNGSIEFPHGINTDVAIGIGKELATNNDNYHRILADRSGLTQKLVRQLCSEESYFDAKKSVRYGFADAVLMPDGTTLDAKAIGGKIQ